MGLQFNEVYENNKFIKQEHSKKISKKISPRSLKQI